MCQTTWEILYQNQKNIYIPLFQDPLLDPAKKPKQTKPHLKKISYEVFLMTALWVYFANAVYLESLLIPALSAH